MADSVEMKADVNVEFDEASSRQQINSGESVKTLFGKIRKFLTDLKAVAFSGSYNDLSNTPTTATKDTDGLMSAEDKGKLDAFEITATGGKLHDKDIATTDLIPTSLPANGGNADTVDNKHYTDFSQNAVLSTIEQVNDPNLESGIYSAENVSMSFSSDVASNWFMLIVNKHRASAGFGTQIAIPYDNGEQRGTFYRICHAGNWGNWIRIADGGNADTVDNIHISCINDAVSNSNWFAAFTNENNLRAIDPGRAYVGNAGLLKSTLIGTAEHCTYHTILDWANSVNGMGQAVIVDGSGVPSDSPVVDEGMVTVETDNENIRKVVTFKSYGTGRGTYRRNIWAGGWRWGWQDISNAEPIKYRDITLSFNSQMSLIVPQDDMPYRLTSIDDAEHIISVIVTKCHITSPDNSILYPYASGKNVGIKSNYANLSGTVILRAAYI